MNNNCIILVKTKNKYISFNDDLDILKYIKFNMNYSYSSLSYLDNFEINYIVLDNLNVVVERKFNGNNYNYNRYLKLMYLSKILNKMVITR